MSVAPSAASRSGRTGLFALAHRRSTLVGVSSPWSVVRSIHVIARSSHAACHSFLTVRRVGIVAARRSTALRLMRSARTRSRSRGTPGLRSGGVNTRRARSGEPAAGVAPAAGVGCSYGRLVSMAACNLRRLFLLRRVPLRLAILLGPALAVGAALRLLALRFGALAFRARGGPPAALWPVSGLAPFRRGLVGRLVGFSHDGGGTVREGGSPSRAGRKAGVGVCGRASGPGEAGRTNGRAFAFGVFVAG